MNIEELEQTYQDLFEKSLQGELDEGEFKDSVEQLQCKDEQGRSWKIGWYTGKWYRYDQGRWLQDEPAPQLSAAPAPEAGSGPADGKKRGARFKVPWLAALLLLFLLVAAGVLLTGWATGWWNGAATMPTKVAEVAADTPTTGRLTTAPSSPTNAPQAATTPTHTPPVPPTAGIVASSPPASLGPSEPLTTATALAPTASVPASAPPALSGQIFFPVYDPERQTFDIHTFRLDEGERQVLVEQASQPSISPDGERLVYRSWNRSQRSLQVRELVDGHTWTWINFAEAARPSWSPDSQNIVFPSQQESDRQWRVYRSLGLRYELVRRDGRDIFGRVPVYLAGGRIAYWECPLNDCGLYIMQADGASPIRLTVNEHDTAPAASPDGSKLAFMSNADGNWEIYVVDTGAPGDLGVQRLTHNPARDGLPAWSPDGQWLAFVTDRDGEWALWTMRSDGSDQHRVLDLAGPLEGEIAYVSADDQHGWTWETIAWGP